MFATLIRLASYGKPRVATQQHYPGKANLERLHNIMRQSEYLSSHSIDCDTAKPVQCTVKPYSVDLSRRSYHTKNTKVYIMGRAHYNIQFVYNVVSQMKAS